MCGCATAPPRRACACSPRTGRTRRAARGGRRGAWGSCRPPGSAPPRRGRRTDRRSRRRTRAAPAPAGHARAAPRGAGPRAGSAAGRRRPWRRSTARGRPSPPSCRAASRPSGDGLDPIELRLAPGLAAQQAGATNAAMPTSTAAMGQRVSAPTTIAATTPSARRSARFSNRTRALGPDRRRGGASAGATGRIATAKVTTPSANSAPSTPATSVTAGLPAPGVDGLRLVDGDRGSRRYGRLHRCRPGRPSACR